MNENDDKPPTEPNTNESSLEIEPKEPSEPLYQSAIDDLKSWAHPQGNPGLLRGAIAHLEASLEQRKKTQ